MEKVLRKHKVCASCLSVGISYVDCICTYSRNYPTIELEFEECACCGSILNDGEPADTHFNDEQFKKLEDGEDIKKG